MDAVSTEDYANKLISSRKDFLSLTGIRLLISSKVNGLSSLKSIQPPAYPSAPRLPISKKFPIAAMVYQVRGMIINLFDIIHVPI